MSNNHVAYEELYQFILACLRKVGVSSESATCVAEGLATTSLFGIDSHGIKLLPHYVRAAKNGRINLNPQYQFTLKSHCAGVLDADHAFGHHAGTVAMNKALQLAKEFGLGAISVANSSHYGAAGFFAIKAAYQDMIGLSFTHADSLMLSANGKRPFFGTNPISFCAPVEGEEPFYLDMATTSISWNQVMLSSSQDQNLQPGWAVDENGDGTIDPKLARALNSIGGYKGYGLSMMIEILCSLLTAMPFGRHISSMYKTPISEHRHLGHFFLAINIAAFTEVDDFKKRLKEMMTELRQEPSKGIAPVMCPGDPQKAHKKHRSEKGIPVLDVTWKEFEGLARDLEVPLPNVKRG